MVRNDKAGPALIGRHPDVVVGAVPQGAGDVTLPVLKANQARKSEQQRGLAGAVRPEDGHNLAGLGAELDAEIEQAPGQPDICLETHHICLETHRSHRPRRAPRMTTLISSMTRLSAMAACGSLSRRK